MLSSSFSFPTKVERKALVQERKRVLKAAWTSSSDNSESEEDAVSVPPNFKKFTIEDRKIILQKPIRVKPEVPGVSYDGPKDAKKIDLAEPGEESRPAWIATNLRGRIAHLNAKRISRCICLDVKRPQGSRFGNLSTYYSNEG